MNRAFLSRLAVCSWSLQPANPHQLIQQVQEIGVSRVQIALDPIREQPAQWGNFADQARQSGIQLISGMFGCVGEDYTTMESIRQTGGILPEATWDQNWRNIEQTAELAFRMNLRLVTFHAGFLPHQPTDPNYAKLLGRLRQIADLFAAKGIHLALETGQETAETLSHFLQELQRPTVGVNFDPANMILYDKGDPISSLRALSPWLKQCHIKDARRTQTPGTWGDEVVVGTGEVSWLDFFRVLEERRFSGFCSIEREAGNQRVKDIKAAQTYLESIAT